MACPRCSGKRAKVPNAERLCKMGGRAGLCGSDSFVVGGEPPGPFPRLTCAFRLFGNRAEGTLHVRLANQVPSLIILLPREASDIALFV